MRKVRYNIAASLDGFIASTDHTTSWIIDDPSIDFAALYNDFSTFIMGRRTYETMLSFGAGNPLKKYPKEAIVVFTRTKEYPDTTVVKEDVVEYVRSVKGQGGGQEKDIWFMGGASLAGALMEDGLVDELEVAIMPVVLGEGVKMAELGRGPLTLKLEAAEVKSSGILMTRYTVEYKGEKHRLS